MTQAYLPTICRSYYCSSVSVTKGGDLSHLTSACNPTPKVPAGIGPKSQAYQPNFSSIICCSSVTLALQLVRSLVLKPARASILLRSVTPATLRQRVNLGSCSLVFSWVCSDPYGGSCFNFLCLSFLMLRFSGLGTLSSLGVQFL